MATPAKVSESARVKARSKRTSERPSGAQLAHAAQATWRRSPRTASSPKCHGAEPFEVLTRPTVGYSREAAGFGQAPRRASSNVPSSDVHRQRLDLSRKSTPVRCGPDSGTSRLALRHCPRSVRLLLASLAYTLIEAIQAHRVESHRAGASLCRYHPPDEILANALPERLILTVAPSRAGWPYAMQANRRALEPVVKTEIQACIQCSPSVPNWRASQRVPIGVSRVGHFSVSLQFRSVILSTHL